MSKWHNSDCPSAHSGLHVLVGELVLNLKETHNDMSPGGVMVLDFPFLGSAVRSSFVHTWCKVFIRSSVLLRREHLAFRMERNMVYWIERNHISLRQIWPHESCDYSMNTKPCGCMPQRHISLCVCYTSSLMSSQSIFPPAVRC